MSGMEYNHRVQVQITNSGSSQYGTPREMSISITDRSSGQLIVEVPMTADQFMAALAGTYHGDMPAWVAKPEYRDRIGKVSQHMVITVPGEINLGYRSQSAIYCIEDVPDVAVPWVQEQIAGHEEWRLSHHNTGWSLHLTDYVDPEDATLTVRAASLVEGDVIISCDDAPSDISGTVTLVKTVRKGKVEITVNDSWCDTVSVAAPVTIKQRAERR